MHDLVIRGGTVVDGTGSTPFRADVAIAGGTIAAIGEDVGEARETLCADGLLVTPGFVDIHTHYDAQVLWDEKIEPAVWHGITTAVIGNCGVGFAPAAPYNRDYLIDLMANVEDIPAQSLAAGLAWSWETFPEYLDVVAAKPRTIGIGALVPLGAVRSYVMRERMHEAPTPADLDRMRGIIREAVAAGAVGLSVSRTVLHQDSLGRTVPGTDATEAELTALVRAMRQTGKGLLEVSPSGIALPEPESVSTVAGILIRIAETTGCPVTFLLTQSNFAPDEYRAVLERCEEAQRRGVPVHPQVNIRPTAIMLSFLADYHPFRSLAAFVPYARLPHAERIAALRRPEVRAAILAERIENPRGIDMLFADPGIWKSIYVMGDPLNYYPRHEHSIAAMAERTGEEPRAIVYDALLGQDGRAFVMYIISNWAAEDAGPLHRMMTSPISVLGLSDGGAHLTAVSDSSQPTTLLTEWVRDRSTGEGRAFSLEAAVKKLTLDNAALFGLTDRGALLPGRRADINLIDLAELGLTYPEMVYDLPCGEPRLDQRARGYRATLVNGEAITRDGALTNALPGKLARI